MKKLKSLVSQFIKKPQTENFVGYLKDGYTDTILLIKEKSIISIFVLFNIFGLSFINAIQVPVSPALQFVYFVFQAIMGFVFQVLIFAGFSFYTNH